MFERYTQPARRVIFFARYEASQFGASYIETEHLLLGLLRECGELRSRLPQEAADEIRKQIEERAPEPRPRVSTSEDLPLSQNSVRALEYAGEESDALKHTTIDCSHLLLGVLRVETSTAAALLKPYGITFASHRVPDIPSVPPNHPAAALQVIISKMARLEETGASLKRPALTRKEALGHLIDWACAHQQGFARALAEPKLTAGGYPENSWLAAQKYEDVAWRELVDLCVSLNRLILHVIVQMPENKLDTPCRIGVADPIPLRELVQRYVAHCEDIAAQLLMRG